MRGPLARRGFLRGLALASASAGSGALALPAVAAPAAPHPDAELIAAGGAEERADAAFRAACSAARAASRAAALEYGEAPEALVLNAEERDLFRRWFFGLPGDPPFPRIRRRESTDGSWVNPDRAWSGRGLRIVIERAVGRLGPAGRTPFLLRRWRQLLPVAEAHDRRVEAALSRHRVSDLRKAEKAAEETWRAARVHVRTLTASTPDGLAVQVRQFGTIYRDSVGDHFLPLLLSAASVSGVALTVIDPRGQA